MSIFTKETVRAAVVQSLIIQGNKEQNLSAAFALLDKAIVAKSKLICLPQAFGSGINFVLLRKMAEPVPDGPIAQTVAERAKAAKAYIAAGILELGEDNKIYDCAVLFDPSGALLVKYRRWILWHGERAFVSQGAKVDVVATDIGKIGLIIGYDICFPESIMHYFMDEVDIIICVASIFDFLSYNVQHLCASRAMDNHCYVLFSSAIGEHPIVQRAYMGYSAITCDPYFMEAQKLIKQSGPGSETLAKAGRGQEFVQAALHVEELQRTRQKKLPFVGDLRTTLSQSN